MRLISILILTLGLILAPANISAAFESPPYEVGDSTKYIPWNDHYRVDFGWPTPSEWTTLRAYFETTSNTPFYTDYTQSQVSRKIMYLNCNGTYQLQFLDGSGDPVYFTKEIVTTAISNPLCQSYPDGGYKDDLGAGYEDNLGGGYDMSWDDLPGADQYEIWKDGQLIDTIPAGSGSYNYHLPEPGGGISIVAKDANGDYIGHSDMQVPDYNGQEDWGTDPSDCGICEKLAAALQCPGWDQYMGELSSMIGNALNKFFGEVPTTPTEEDIVTNIVPDLPTLNTDVPDAGFDIAVPEEFDEPFIYDVTTAPVIPVIDESEAFEIYEPDEYIESDLPGVMVYPNDERNDSNGIKHPDTITTEYNMPEPATTPTPTETPEIPPSEMPIPSDESGGSGAVPGATASPEPAPTPTITGG